MRLLGVVFFVLLAANVAMLLLAPSPPPRWYQLVRMVLALGMVACITAQVVSEWASRRRAKRQSSSGPVQPPQ